MTAQMRSVVPLDRGVLLRRSKRVGTPRLLLHIRSGLRRLDITGRAEAEPQPADRAWREMLRRLDARDTERRLDAVERALNAGAER